MFSTQAQPVVKKSFYQKLSSQPHQPFFANGVIFLILFVFVLLLSYTNMVSLKVPLASYHAYALIFVVFIQFFLGFLFVVFPRFLMQAEIETKVYMTQFNIYFVGTVLFFISLFIGETLTILASFIIFIAQLLSFKTLYGIFNKSIHADKYDTKWVLIAFSSGLAANLLYIISYIKFDHYLLVQKVAINAGFYLFLFSLIFTISQRMIPFFTSVKVQGYKINKSKALMEKVFGLLALKVMILTFDAPALNLLADIPLFILFTKELLQWKLPLKGMVPVMWVLFISVYWIPVAFFVSILESVTFLSFAGEIVFEKSVIHILAVGYFATILLGFGTRVVLGHSGRTPMADKLTTAIFIAVQAIVLIRVFASYSITLNLDYVFYINLSAVLFTVGLLIWSVKYLPILFEDKK